MILKIAMMMFDPKDIVSAVSCCASAWKRSRTVEFWQDVMRIGWRIDSSTEKPQNVGWIEKRQQMFEMATAAQKNRFARAYHALANIAHLPVKTRAWFDNVQEWYKRAATPSIKASAITSNARAVALYRRLPSIDATFARPRFILGAHEIGLNAESDTVMVRRQFGTGSESLPTVILSGDSVLVAPSGSLAKPMLRYLMCKFGPRFPAPTYRFNDVFAHYELSAKMFGAVKTDILATISVLRAVWEVEHHVSSPGVFERALDVARSHKKCLDIADVRYILQ